jgi:phosphoglycolate phosphatase-like HAD superfamily hydrolase
MISERVETPARLRSVSFDLDGTFADTSVDLASALNAVREELGYRALPVADVARYVGRGARWLVTHCLPEQPGAELEPLVLSFLGHYRARCTVHTVAYPGMIELAEELNRDGVVVSIATNKPRKYTELIVAGLGWSPLFHSVHCGDDGPSKPDPAMIDAAIRAAGTTAATHWHIGDTPTDAAAALNAGCAFLAVAWGMDEGAGLREDEVPLLADGEALRGALLEALQ